MFNIYIPVNQKKKNIYKPILITFSMYMWNNFYPLTKPKYKITLIPLSRKENGGTVGDSEILGSQDSLVLQLGED